MPATALKQAEEETWEIKRARIAQASQSAANLPGNANGPDLEEFVLRYSIKFSAFA